jgi:rubrerythrin
MESTKALEILKTAILLEKRGESFYRTVAEKTNDENTRQVFSTLAEEEVEHSRFLSEQYSHYTKNKSFKKITEAIVPDDSETQKVLTDAVKNKISAASFEAAAIAAAIDMENKAIAVYSERAESAEDPAEKELYKMLAEWEQSHHKLLKAMDDDLKQRVWDDNNFWPF